MRQSTIFQKTLKKTPKEAETISHQYLLRADFIDQLSSGIYSFLPLGWRVHQKIETIIREEMNALGGQEVFLPTLQPKELWLETNRWQTIDPPLFKTKDRHEQDFGLGSTHEEVIIDLTRRRVQSYRDLPLALYQIQNKFRNELRPTGGLLRTREFVMKDLYSFHVDKNDLMNFYQKARAAYLKIFKTCGLKVKVIEASGGTIGGELTNEFMVFNPAGEDRIISCAKCDWAANIEISQGAKKCPHCGGLVKEERGIEIGHIFALGTGYSEKMNVHYLDKDGKKKLIWMGCYGIGLSRLLAAIVESHHDEKGIIWPEAVAPFQQHLLAIWSGELKTDRKIKKAAEQLYQRFLKQGREVLFDDRENVSAGVKFAEADLIGIPERLVISAKTLQKNSVEIKKRESNKIQLIKLSLRA